MPNHACVQFGFTWKDWCYMTENDIALRHHDKTADAKAEHEENGATGDAAPLVVPKLWVIDGKADEKLEHSLEDITAELNNRLDVTKQWPYYADEAAFYLTKFLESNTTLAEKKECIIAYLNLALAAWVKITTNNYILTDHDYLLVSHPNAREAEQHDFDLKKYPLGKCASVRYRYPSHLRIHLTAGEHVDTDLTVATITGTGQAFRRNIFKSKRKAAIVPADIIKHVDPVRECPSQTIDMDAWGWKHYAAIGVAGALAVFGIYRYFSGDSGTVSIAAPSTAPQFKSK